MFPLYSHHAFCMRRVCDKDAHPMTCPSSLGSKMMQLSPIGPAKYQHDASLCTCHRKRLGLFLRYKPDWLMSDLCSAFSL